MVFEAEELEGLTVGVTFEVTVDLTFETDLTFELGLIGAFLPRAFIFVGGALLHQSLQVFSLNQVIKFST